MEPRVTRLPLPPEELLRQAATALRDADALLVTAGAGMGVDSGLPDFRGGQGFWRAYPPLARLGLRFEQMAQPHWFAHDPALAWGFYGHRLNLYRATSPHGGFVVLRRWMEHKPGGGFVFTSNIDGQFQRAGFDQARIVECHGSIHTLQCAAPCADVVWSANATEVVVDAASLRARPPLPSCPRCGGVARPNALLFDDTQWLFERSQEQQARLVGWVTELAQQSARLVVVECGAGRAIPTVRWFGERCAAAGAALVRINPQEPHGPQGTISLSMGALAALTQIDALL